MRQPRTTIWAERTLIALFLASLGGALILIMVVHRRASMTSEAIFTEQAEIEKPTATGPANDPKPLRVAAPVISPSPHPTKLPAPPAEDPTKKALAELASAATQEIEAARQADRRTESLEKARLSAVAESDRWRRREMLVRQQVAALADRAKKIDRQIDTLAAERDALARERDALKAAVAKSQQGQGSYAVLPYKGPNGSWRRPIVLECSNGTVTLRPKGPTFTMLDLSSLINPRSSPVIIAVARELLRVQMSESPDGAPVVPYFVFLIRPDGIRSYYEIRARLEPLGIAFGYELIDQDLKVDVPDYDNLATWDGTIPLEEPLMPAPARRTNDTDDGLAWPSSGTGSKAPRGGAGNGLARSGNTPGDGDAGTESQSPDDFVWPSQRGKGPSRTAANSKNAGPGLSANTDLAEGSGSGHGPGQAKGSGSGTVLGQGTGTGTGPGQGSGGGGLGRAQGGGGNAGLVPRTGGNPGLARRGGSSPSGLGQGSQPTGLAGGTSGSGGRDGSGSGSGDDPALKPWPFPDQDSEPGAGGLGSGQNLADGKTKSGSRPGGSGPGSSSGGSGHGQGDALLPDLEPANSGLSNTASGTLGGDLAVAAAGSIGQNGLSHLKAPASSAAGSPVGPLTATGTGTKLAGTGDTNSRQSPAAGGGPSDSTTNTRASGSQPDTSSVTSTDATDTAQNGKGGTGDRSGTGGNPQAVAGLDSLFGSQGSNSSTNPSSTSGVTGTASSSMSSTNASTTNASAGALGLSMPSMIANTSTTTSGPSGLVFGSDASSNSSQSKASADGPVFKSRIQDGPTKKIDVPFEIVVVCDANGAVIHPGGYQLTNRSMETGKKNSIMVRELLAVAQKRAESDPTIRPQPRVKFLVENGGSETFWAVRKQILFSGLGWPMSLQVAGGQDPHVLGKETW